MTLTITRRPLDNHAGTMFIAESSQGRAGHCVVFHGQGVYSSELYTALYSMDTVVRREHCIGEIDTDSETTALAILSDVVAHAQDAKGDLVTIGLYAESFDEFFPETDRTRWLQTALCTLEFEPAPGTEGHAMMRFLPAQQLVDSRPSQSISQVLPKSVISHPGNRETFARVMRATVEQLERVLSQPRETLLNEGYSSEELDRLREEAETAREWAR